jgi:hypothetical protein
MRDAGAAADKWGAMTRGARWQQLGAGVSASERVDAVLTSGTGSTVPPDSVFKPNQIYLKRIQICPKF